MNKALIAYLLVVLISSGAQSKDWPMYRANPSRTAYTTDSLPSELSLRWKYRSAHAPAPAWPRSDRLPFDRAYQLVVAGGQVYFGSSVDNKVYALDTKTGQINWTFFTDAPVRFAPVAWKDRVFAASDDGHLYALDSQTGKLLWKVQGGPNRRLILGNERMISKYPARGGPVVKDDLVYFAAGIWPSDGIYLYAVDAESGKIVWKNDDSGSLYMPQPHGGANAKSGVSAQGYLVVSENRLLLPTGRAVPASFDRISGKFQYFRLQQYGHNGGAPTMAVGEMFFNSGVSFDQTTGKKVSNVGSGVLAATPDTLVRADAKSVTEYRWTEVEKPDRKGNPIKTKVLQEIWKAKTDAPSSAIIIAGSKVIVGKEGKVEAFDRELKKSIWSHPLKGTAYGVVVVSGMLFVSTDQGLVYCFDENEARRTEEIRSSVDESPYQESAAVVAAAEEIIRRSGMTEGYCLDLGCDDGHLAYELAKRTKLHIVAVESDSKKVAVARKKLDAAGVYGSRVTVLHRELTDTGLPKYFVDLIISGRFLEKTSSIISKSEILRLQRPYGGVMCLGKAGTMTKSVRGPLEGAGQWTHQYANPANTLCSDDQLVGDSLSMLWFRDVAFDLPQRHGRGPAPLFHDGILLHEGLDGIVALNAYNGRFLWKHEVQGVLRPYNGDELMGVAGTGSNFCSFDDSIYLRDEDKCLRIEATTGKLLDTFKTPRISPDEKTTWGYIACSDGILFGSVANPEHVVTYRYINRGGDMNKLLTESSSLFAMDAKSGELLWQYQAKHSIRHNAVAIADGRVFLIDRPMALFDRVKKSKTKEHPTGILVTLDEKSGELLWQEDTDIYGTMLAAQAKHGVLLMSYQPTRFRLDSEIGGRMTAFSIEDGKQLWEVKAPYESRPMINDYTVYAQGGAWDLRTGAKKPFNFKRSYGCGILAGSAKMMFFRSATLGYFNLAENKEMENFGGVRPGCWVNAIPAGGIVLVPDASSGCQCSYLNRAWFALESQVGSALSIK